MFDVSFCYESRIVHDKDTLRHWCLSWRGKRPKPVRLTLVMAGARNRQYGRPVGSVLQAPASVGATPSCPAQTVPRTLDTPSSQSPRAELLGRMAVTEKCKGTGLGALTLMNALDKSLVASRDVASWAVYVEAIDNDAAAFYRKYGFIELPDDRLRLFLPMKTIAKVFSV
jgi:hypothetical protein